MNESTTTAADPTPAQKARLVMDILHRTIVHYGLWYTEVRHQMGTERALEATYPLEAEQPFFWRTGP